MSVATSIVVGVGLAAKAGADIFSGAKQAEAADQKLAAEKEALQKQIDERARVTGLAREQAQISRAEIASINKLLSTQGEQLTKTLNSISKQQELLDAMDPQVKAAGSELLGLLKGEAAKSLAPVQAQITRQRNELKNRMASTIGPGWETSSAGMEAMARFDAQSSLQMSQVQQTALNSAASIYGGLSGNQLGGQQGVTAATANAFANAADIDKTVLAANQNIQNRKVGAEIGAVNSTPVNFAGPVQSAGAGAAAWGNAFSGLGNDIGQVAGQAYGAEQYGKQFQNALDKANQNSFSNAMSPFTKLPAAQTFGTGKVTS